MSERPNILVITTDQQRADSLACYGNVFVHSPNIDRLASEGVRFLDAFTPFPLCTPAGLRCGPEPTRICTTSWIASTASTMRSSAVSRQPRYSIG